jgi:zinc finger HIT domain-containing protein 1
MPLIEEIPRGHKGRHVKLIVPDTFQSTTVTTARRQRNAYAADAATRSRAQSKRLADLERENYHDNVKIEIPKLDLLVGPNMSKGGVRVGATVNSRRILGSKKTLTNHLDDDPSSTRLLQESYAPASRYPPRYLCSICGYWGKVTCIRCGARYCSLGCEETHRETRCLKVYG